MQSKLRKLIVSFYRFIVRLSKARAKYYKRGYYM
jgi:hypothetical protein